MTAVYTATGLQEGTTIVLLRAQTETSIAYALARESVARKDPRQAFGEYAGKICGEPTVEGKGSYHIASEVKRTYENGKLVNQFSRRHILGFSTLNTRAVLEGQGLGGIEEAVAKATQAQKTDRVITVATIKDSN